MSSNIEKIKNVLIVVLVSSTILLLYFLWNDGGGFRLPVPGAVEIETILLKDVLNPDRLTVSFGEENYTELSSPTPLWGGGGQARTDGDGDGEGAQGDPSFLDAFRVFSGSADIMVGAISESDFRDVMRARSIQAEFTFAIPLSGFCGEYGLERPPQLDVIDAFTCIAYSEASPNSVFICNKLDDRYYRLAIDGEAARFKELIAYIEARSDASFYPLRAYSGVENDVMVPLDMRSGLSETPYRSDMDGSLAGGDAITDMAKGFFGESFDFTRKITEGNGNTVYMYGYGEKVLIIHRDGSLEYRAAETGDGGSSGSAGYFEALTLALDFIARHGELESPGGAAKQIYLKSVGYADEGRRAYRFSFGVRIDGYAVHYVGSQPFVVEVAGGRVTYYARDMIDCMPEAGLAGGTERSYAPFDLLAENFQGIYLVLADRDADGGPAAGPQAALSDEAMFDSVVERVSKVSVGLLRPAPPGAGGAGAAAGPRSGELLPVWVLTIDGMDFYFGLYSGEGAGHTA
ncbi:MAG: hypothetical protein LBS32_07290 [Clostridiales Family XIII bacterium]|nr:hypothetical protein [Clostridiales Family XIII bacterium]